MTDGVQSSELFSARATALVATHEDDAPLFLYYAAQTPHAHYVGAPARHEAAAQAQGFQLSEPRFQIAALVSALEILRERERERERVVEHVCVSPVRAQSRTRSKRAAGGMTKI